MSGTKEEGVWPCDFQLVITEIRFQSNACSRLKVRLREHLCGRIHIPAAAHAAKNIRAGAVKL